MKVFDNASTLEVKFEGDHYTIHGFHLNTKGKDHSAKLLRFAINSILHINEVTPITMNWNGIQEVPLTKNLGKNGEQMCHSSELVDRQVVTLHHEANNIRVTGRERKIPVTRTNVFFIVDEGLINVKQVIVNQTSIRNPHDTLVEDIS
jgi:hypothetical protein